MPAGRHDDGGVQLQQQGRPVDPVARLQPLPVVQRGRHGAAGEHNPGAADGGMGRVRAAVGRRLQPGLGYGQLQFEAQVDDFNGEGKIGVAEPLPMGGVKIGGYAVGKVSVVGQ